MKRRERLFRWMCPEVVTVLEQAKDIVSEYEKAKDSLKIEGKEVRAKEGVVFLGDVTNSSVTVTPKLYTEVNLSRFELKSLLHVDGKQQTVAGSTFHAHNSTVTGTLANASEKDVDGAKGILPMKREEERKKWNRRVVRR